MRFERWGVIRRERFGFGDEGVVVFVVDFRMYKFVVYFLRIVFCGNIRRLEWVFELGFWY